MKMLCGHNDGVCEMCPKESGPEVNIGAGFIPLITIVRPSSHPLSAKEGSTVCQCGPIPHSLFDYYVVIDFEATCEKDVRIRPQEIIEFPAILVHGVTGELVSAFRTYVRPRYRPILTDFCRELTGIKQEDVDSGVDIAEALSMHDAWLAAAGAAADRIAVVTWGDWDCKTMLDSECRLKNLVKPFYFDQWVNLRVPFESVFGVKRRNLQEAIQEAGLRWDGRLHCGLDDDARNTAWLLADLMRRGVTISITGMLAPKEGATPQPPLRVMAQPLLQIPMCCYCGVPIKSDQVMTPGPMLGRHFCICGNWAPEFGAICPFFLWAA
ncbi:hypothetical protein BS78_04G118200 [Paspalum vaginatum]|nr:hypothetical protein BS78_04G118200 [Paspalum vaginatum]KAJ1278961.1 hypothetical protein BS78_04G118200 [Paspalum vaginatum]